MPPDLLKHLKDPLKLIRFLWPQVTLYDKQREITLSVEHDDETYVVAGNQLGKDFIAGLVILGYFIRKHPVKIVTTSATEKHLDTLWGEVDRFIRTSRLPLIYPKGPLVYNQRSLGKIVNGTLEKDSYAKAVVASSDSRGEGLAGHHAAYTLFVADEASGLPQIAYSMAQGWAKRMLIFGNPNECNNFFRQGVKAGNLLAE